MSKSGLSIDVILILKFAEHGSSSKAGTYGVNVIKEASRTLKSNPSNGTRA